MSCIESDRKGAIGEQLQLPTYRNLLIPMIESGLHTGVQITSKLLERSEAALQSAQVEPIAGVGPSQVVPGLAQHCLTMPDGSGPSVVKQVMSGDKRVILLHHIPVDIGRLMGEPAMDMKIPAQRQTTMQVGEGVGLLLIELIHPQKAAKLIVRQRVMSHRLQPALPEPGSPRSKEHVGGGEGLQLKIGRA